MALDDKVVTLAITKSRGFAWRRAVAMAGAGGPNTIDLLRLDAWACAAGAIIYSPALLGRFLTTLRRLENPLTHRDDTDEEVLW